MSWIYSILFTGLALISDGESAVGAKNVVNDEPVAVHEAVRDVTEKFDQTYPLNPNGRVSVSNVNGSIVVEAWDRNEVRVEAEKIADSNETLGMIELKIRSTPDRLSIETDYGNFRYGEKQTWVRRKAEVNYKLSVPRTAVLNEIETVNGSVSVSNFVNQTRISAVNGTITAKNLRGTANLSTVNGSVECDFERLESGSKISLSTVNGRVNLVLPSDVNATVKADTLNGNITNDFGLPVRKGEYVGRDLHGRIGSGEVQIKLDSVNGRLSIGKRNDGRTPNPAVNLLPQSGSSDLNVDIDVDTSSTRKINRSIDRSVRESQKQAAQVAKEVQKEMEKIGPELEKIKVKELEGLKEALPGVVSVSVKEGLRVAAESLAAMGDFTWVSGSPRMTKQTNTFAVEGKTRVAVEAKGCNVMVRGWDRSEVKYTLTETSRNLNDTDVKVEENTSKTEVRLRVAGADQDLSRSFGPSRASYRLEVFVPRRSDVSVTTNGEVRIGGVSGSVNISGEDESINIRDVEGKLNIAAADAQVRIIGFSGDLETKTADGAIYLEGKFSSIKSTIADGDIILTLPDSANATIASNRDVTTESLTLVRENDRKWRLGTGGPLYEFEMDEGRLIIRNSSAIAAN